jgi:hypothetical protein
MEFAAERALWAQEKVALRLALAQAEADVIHGCRCDAADTDDRVSSCIFLKGCCYVCGYSVSRRWPSLELSVHYFLNDQQFSAIYEVEV